MLTSGAQLFQTPWCATVSVRLDIAEAFLKNAKGLLAAAATTEVSPKPFFGRVTKAAVVYSDDCRFAHTFRGSFGFAIESPVEANLRSFDARG